MKFSHFFIQRPIFAGVLSVVIFLVGLISMYRLPISEYPEVVPPQVVVRAVYPGANPKTISETVSVPLEQQLNGVENSLYTFSQATSDGVMTLTVTFKLGTDIDQAQQLVQNRVALAEPGSNKEEATPPLVVWVSEIRVPIHKAMQLVGLCRFPLAGPVNLERRLLTFACR